MILLVVGGVAIAVGVATLLSYVGSSQPLVVPVVPEKPDRLIQAVNESIWTCQYCNLDNEKEAAFCGRCGSPRKFSVLISHEKVIK